MSVAGVSRCGPSDSCGLPLFPIRGGVPCRHPHWQRLPRSAVWLSLGVGTIKSPPSTKEGTGRACQQTRRIRPRPGGSDRPGPLGAFGPAGGPSASNCTPAPLVSSPSGSCIGGAGPLAASNILSSSPTLLSCCVSICVRLTFSAMGSRLASSSVPRYLHCFQFMLERTGQRLMATMGGELLTQISPIGSKPCRRYRGTLRAVVASR
jgi:hypothetical protein